MMRGTSPIHVFRIPFNVDVIDKVRIIYSQKEKPVVIKESEDCTFENNTIKTKLTQEDTLAIDHKKPVEVQVRILSVSGDPLVSTIKAFRVGRCLDNEVI